MAENEGEPKGRRIAHDGMPIKPPTRPLEQGISSGREIKPPVPKPPESGKKK